MDNAVNAVNKLFSSNPSATDKTAEEKANSSLKNTTTNPSDADTDTDTTVSSTTAPSVQHTHVEKQHETREQTFVDKEKHQDHYHTTIQPLTDSEVKPEKHDYTQETKHKNVDKDDGSARRQAEEDRAGFESTKDVKKSNFETKEPTVEGEHVHHHLHETVQPVIEKNVLDPSVTHKRVDVKEKIQEPAENHGVTTNSTMSVDDFEKKIADGKN